MYAIFYWKGSSSLTPETWTALVQSVGTILDLFAARTVSIPLCFVLTAWSKLMFTCLFIKWRNGMASFLKNPRFMHCATSYVSVIMVNLVHIRIPVLALIPPWFSSTSMVYSPIEFSGVLVQMLLNIIFNCLRLVFSPLALNNLRPLLRSNFSTITLSIHWNARLQL